MPKYLLYALLGVVLLVAIGYAVMGSGAVGTGINPQPTASTISPGRTLGGGITTLNAVPSLMANSSSIGTQGQPSMLSGPQCRNTCRATCGGVRPIFQITKREKSRRLCWNNCKSSYCRLVPDSELNG